MGKIIFIRNYNLVGTIRFILGDIEEEDATLFAPSVRRVAHDSARVSVRTVVTGSRKRIIIGTLVVSQEAVDEDGLYHELIGSQVTTDTISRRYKACVLQAETSSDVIPSDRQTAWLVLAPGRIEVNVPRVSQCAVCCVRVDDVHESGARWIQSNFWVSFFLKTRAGWIHSSNTP